MYSKNDLVVEPGAKITSLILNECTTEAGGNSDLYECMSPDYDKSELNE